MADIKIKSGFNRAETNQVVEDTTISTAVKASILADSAHLTSLGEDTDLRAALKAYFDTIYAPIV